MGYLLEILYDVLFQPAAAMGQIAGRRLVGKSLVVFIVSILLPSWAMWFGLKSTSLGYAVNGIIVMHVIGSLLLWFFGAALLHLIAEFMGGRGTAMGLFAALGFAQFPRIFMVPLWVVAAVLPESIRPVVMGITALVIMFWVLALHIAALKGAYGIGGVKATLVLIMPFLAVTLFVIAIVTFVSVQFMQWPQWS